LRHKIQKQEREMIMKFMNGAGAACSAADSGPPASSGADQDTLSRDGAMALAKRLQEFWHGRGYTAARFWAEPVEERFAKVGTYELYRVACNLVNGMPPRYRDESSVPR
jgi:hypothetical protein